MGTATVREKKEKREQEEGEEEEERKEEEEAGRAVDASVLEGVSGKEEVGLLNLSIRGEYAQCRCGAVCLVQGSETGGVGVALIHVGSSWGI